MFEQQGQSRATHGARLLPQLAARLTQEFGRGFDVKNLRHMRAFYQAFPIRDALRRELSWMHYRRLDNDVARQWYVNEAVNQNWSSRALERQINTLYYERLLVSQDKAAVAAEAKTSIDVPEPDAARICPRSGVAGVPGFAGHRALAGV